jgi:formamidopyrimidine-DNA glycosylase
MPELPEVETVVRLIRPRIEGRTIERTRVSWRRTLGGVTPGSFDRELRGAAVRRVWRRGKYIVFDLERDGEMSGWMVGHLRMTGRFHVEDRAWRPGQYGRVRLDLDDGRSFHFIDVRKFGRLTFATDLGAHLADLGPEPLGDEFTVPWLRAALRARRRMLKPLLLDQTFLAGLGNIYVDEALNLARLHPLRRSDRVGTDAARRLHVAIRTTLEAAVEREGSSFDTFYRTPEGQPGSYQHQFRVYGREGKPCPACGAAVVRIVVAQRGTHFCRRCQRSPRLADARSAAILPAP